MELAQELQESLEKGIISGSIIAKLKRKSISEMVQTLPTSPFLATILVGDNPASQQYVSYKEKACNEIGIRNTIIRLNENISQQELINEIEKLNSNLDVNGILLQLPLPDHLDTITIMNTINQNKDVDGLTYLSVGRLHSGLSVFIPCTPAGIMELFDYANIELEGKNAVILGRSNLVGKPLARLLEKRNATVTLCHSKTVNLSHITQNADILVSAIGKPKLVTKDMIQNDCIVIDVGTNRVEGKLTGDVDFEEVSKKASLITPVPGGVGPMTITMLLYNTVKAYKIQNIRS